MLLSKRNAELQGKRRAGSWGESNWAASGARASCGSLRCRRPQAVKEYAATKMSLSREEPLVTTSWESEA